MAFSNKSVEKISKYFRRPYFSAIVRITQGARSDDLALRARRPRAHGFAFTRRLKYKMGMNLTMRLTRATRARPLKRMIARFGRVEHPYSCSGNLD
jgi:hypothetical protein